MRDYLLYN